LIALPVIAQAPTPNKPASRPVRLRVAWGGGEEARRWSGQIALSEGTFADVQLLGMEFDAAGAIWLDGNVIHVDAMRAHRFDGFDVTVNATDAARIKVDLTSAGMAAPFMAEVPIAEVARQPLQKYLDDKKNRLLVHRSPGDALRIELDRETLFF